MSHAQEGEGQFSYSDQRLFDGRSVDERPENQMLRSSQKKFVQFFNEWRQDQIYIYKDHIKANYRQGQYEVEVDWSDLQAFDTELAGNIRRHPVKFMPLFERAALEVVAESMVPKPKEGELKPIQVVLTNLDRPAALRTLSAKDISKLVCVPGIVISAYKVQCKATTITIQCTTCKATQPLRCPAGFGSAPIPRVCPNAQSNQEQQCPLDPFIVMPDKCEFVDTQKLRLQELPEMVPTGEMPRHIMLSCDRSLVARANPGARLNVIGIYSIYQAKQKGKNSKASANVRYPYLRVVGLQPDRASLAGKGNFSPEEQAELEALSRDPNLYDKLTQSLAPSIFGHEDIKKAIVCLLFGGTRKFLPSGSKLRGDINILLMGDPSVAKSQLLKGVEKTAPIAVYTSGKGSSAAGLTASVIRDAQGEFHLEGGAMVLADGGVVCIDEFDKMRDEDRVAIHEAMEQQTISIAKAGITTILNSRCSVLAAANPTFGRYDDFKKPTENIDFETTILSRFDLIFIIRDRRDVARDKMLAKHILAVHMNKETPDLKEPEIDPDLYTKYVSFCRQKCKPHLSEEAAELLRNQYVSFRTEAKRRQDENGMAAIPITVRQLEAIIRISESLAKMQLSNQATIAHVQESIRLFKISTMKAAASGSVDSLLMQEQNSEFVENVQRAERNIRRRVAIGSKTNYSRLVQEFVNKQHDENAVRKAIDNMKSRGEVEFQAQGRYFLRRT